MWPAEGGGDRLSCFCYKMEWLLIGVRSVLIVIGIEDKGGDGGDEEQSKT